MILKSFNIIIILKIFLLISNIIFRKYISSIKEIVNKYNNETQEKNMTKEDIIKIKFNRKIYNLDEYLSALKQKVIIGKLSKKIKNLNNIFEKNIQFLKWFKQ